MYVTSNKVYIKADREVIEKSAISDFDNIEPVVFSDISVSWYFTPGTVVFEESTGLTWFIQAGSYGGGLSLPHLQPLGIVNLDPSSGLPALVVEHNRPYGIDLVPTEIVVHNSDKNDVKSVLGGLVVGGIIGFMIKE